MEVEVYYNAGRDDDEPGLRIERVLARLREAGVAYRVIETSEQPQEDVERAYGTRAVPAAMVRQYGIRRLFGTHSKPGVFFGREVPALVVVEGGRPQDVYPHQERDGNVVSIEDYVDSVARARERAELARRMDEFSAKVGPVGFSMTELIREARDQRSQQVPGE
jgi:hypothetical protein